MRGEHITIGDILETVLPRAAAVSKRQQSCIPGLSSEDPDVELRLQPGRRVCSAKKSARKEGAPRPRLMQVAVVALLRRAYPQVSSPEPIFFPVFRLLVEVTCVCVCVCVSLSALA